MDFIEGKDRSPSYLNLGYFVSFSKFCNQSYLTRTRWTLAIIIDISAINQKPVPLLFSLMPPLRNRSRVDLGEFFRQAGLHRFGPTSGSYSLKV